MLLLIIKINKNQEWFKKNKKYVIIIYAIINYIRKVQEGENG